MIAGDSRLRCESEISDVKGQPGSCSNARSGDWPMGSALRFYLKLSLKLN